MTRLLSRALLASVVLSAACADAVTAPGAGSNDAAPSLSPTGPSLERGSSGDDGPPATVGEIASVDERQVFDIRQEGVDYAARSAALNTASPSGALTQAGIQYHGGPVLQAGTKVVAIYWSASTIYAGGPAAGTTGIPANDNSLVGYFLRNLGGSSYFNINTTYTNSAGTAIANSMTYTKFWANNAGAPSGTQSVSDAQMANMLASGFSSGKIAYDPSTIYLIFTAGKVNLGGGFHTQYCAYHTYVTMNINGVSRTVIYAAMPFTYAYPTNCTNGTKSPNNDPGADAEVSVLAHEIEESTTDYRLNAWYDTAGNENADKCAWTWGATYTTANGGLANMKIGTKDFLVQQNWVNKSGYGCRKQYP